MIRLQKKLKGFLKSEGLQYLDHCLGAFQRILPHVEVGLWKKCPDGRVGARWGSEARDVLKVRIGIGDPYGDRDNPLDDGFSETFETEVRRKLVVGRSFQISRTLDDIEKAICMRIARKISVALSNSEIVKATGVLNAMRSGFDERVVSEHIRLRHKLHLDAGAVVAALHKLSEQTYENKALSFGCLLDPRYEGAAAEPSFPEKLLSVKKYRALSDGFQTAYRVSRRGHVIEFVDLTNYVSHKHSPQYFYPYWAEGIAKASKDGVCGIALTRNGDILVFDNGTLRFTYRRGNWQYWNHAHLLQLIGGLARAQHVPRKNINGLISSLYASALDVSFRHSGGLILLLRNARDLSHLLIPSDIMRTSRRSVIDTEVDYAIRDGISRPIFAELAGLDGAIVITNNRIIRSYAAILRHGRSRLKKKPEGSRSQAASKASLYGIAIKISSDGDITVYSQDKEFIRIG